MGGNQLCQTNTCDASELVKIFCPLKQVFTLL